MSAGCPAPWWRMLLLRIAPWLFRVCPGGNWHWRSDWLCVCCEGENGQGWYVFKRFKYGPRGGKWLHVRWCDPPHAYTED